MIEARQEAVPRVPRNIRSDPPSFLRKEPDEQDA